MTPPARAEAAALILDAVLSGASAEATLTRWARGARYAGSKDRAAVRDLVFDALRRLRSAAAQGGGRTGRGLVAGLAVQAGDDPDALFTAARHAPAPLAPEERAAMRTPTPAEATDVPDWLHPPLRAALGETFEPVCALLRERAPLHLRANLLRTDAEGLIAALAAEEIAARTVPLSSTAVEVTQGARRLRGSSVIERGLAEPQDAASQAVADAVPLPAGARVLDWCAGGGGKTLALAARLGGTIDAWDADPGRMRDLPARAARAGASVRGLGAPPAGEWDVILCDAPCSGSGTWRRAPEAKWRLSPERVDELAALQDAILAAAARRLAPGGRLIYATCSLLRAENEDRPAPPGTAFAESRRISPLEGGDGFYIAQFFRKG